MPAWRRLWGLSWRRRNGCPAPTGNIVFDRGQERCNYSKLQALAGSLMHNPICVAAHHVRTLAVSEPSSLTSLKGDCPGRVSPYLFRYAFAGYVLNKIARFVRRARNARRAGISTTQFYTHLIGSV